MSVTIPESHKDLLEKPVFISLSTVMPDGQPQASVVWCSYDGEHILINTVKGRQKDKNLQARPMATILAMDPDNPYRYLEVRGSVAGNTEEGAVDHINQLAHLYADQPNYYGGVAPAELEGQETRIIYKIAPSKIVAFPPPESG